jgi:integrase
MWCDGGGLYLQVTRTLDRKDCNRSWIFRYRASNGNGQSRLRDMGLGPLSTLSLSEARDKARTLRQQRLDGLDPIEHRRAVKAKAAAEGNILTFDQAAMQFLAEREHTWRNQVHRNQWRQTIQSHASPVIGKLPVGLVETKHITQILDPIWKSTPTTAERLRARLELILDWAKVRGHRQGENPARWRGHLSNIYVSAKRDKHHAALPYVEVAGFMQSVRDRSGATTRALEFLILTACRTNEVLGARWEEIDLDTKTWTVPAERMKAGKEHKVPLSRAALDIIKAQAGIREGDFVFNGAQPGEPLNSFALLQVVKKINPGITAHGFRSSFMDWCHEQTSFPKAVIDLALAHTIGDKVEAAYRRGDLLEKRRALMQSWSDFCAKPKTKGNNVRPIRGIAS